MGTTPKISVRRLSISISCVGLLFVFCGSVWTQEAKKANPGIKELQQQRLAALEQIRDIANKLFTNARTSFEDVHLAERELLAARLEYAATKNDRIKACDEAIQKASDWEELAQEMKQTARATGITELKAHAFLLEAQIMREKVATLE